jgi:tRNA G10  N-methylase Trm11
MVGTNAELFPQILQLYVPPGARVADVTYGRGVFWRQVPSQLYEVLTTDLSTGVDCRALPYADASLDALVFDPPYAHGGLTMKASINRCYRNANGSHESIMRLYAAGVLEAARVLRVGGRLVVKTQDEIESGRQRLTHLEVIELVTTFGFRLLDLFVLLQRTVPAIREPRQAHARKNHSYFVVAEFRR